ncbi:hypothetical protein hmeg3_10235 [Herbaspirillum sp. meg3]|uniref:DUF3857 domain-containing transglutaminase family protein n=1 Tax=Herbaspirillum sp. meg3 TaxID=2025949 RepID=UPI000B988005|nr:DUF3857 and transglutaminase domain-containing protein [Herbaspirillum sp. meg3]ASU38635.1 hypothetical protein hmeg3_10235 [Herbaspirillum sp. meg3]
MVNIPSRIALATVIAFICSTASVAAVTDFKIVKLDNQIQINQDGLFEQTIEMQVKLETARGVQQSGQLPLPYVKDMNSLSIEEAATIKADGRRIPVDMKKAVFDQPLPMTTQAPMYSQLHLKSVVFPALEPGDSVVVRYAVREKEGLFPGRFSFPMVFSENIQYGDVHLQVRAPASMTLHLEQVGVAAPIVQEKDGWKTYDWRYASPKKEASDETREISILDTDPRLIVSTFKDWADFAAQYDTRSTDKAAVTPVIQKLADDITQGVTDKREQARLLYNWVSQNIRYVAVYLGAGPVVPHASSSILDNRYGDCKDHVVLLEALLSAKGIVSSPALINAGSSYRMPSVALSNTLFNHVITYLPEFDQFIDATGKDAAFGELAFVLGDKPTLLTKSGEIRKTPPHNSANTFARYDARVDFDADGNAAVSVSKKMAGYESPKYRLAAATQTPAERAKAALDSAKLIGDIVFDDDDPKTLALGYAMRWSGKLNKLADFDVRYMNIPYLPQANDLTGYANSVRAKQTRRQDAICPGKTVELHYRMTFPAKVEVASLPQNVDIQRGGVRYTASYSRDGRTVDVRRMLDRPLASNVCTPAQLREWLPVAQAILKDHRSAILFK